MEKDLTQGASRRPGSGFRAGVQAVYLGVMHIAIGKN